MLEKGVYEAARRCLLVYGGNNFKTDKENMVEGGSSKVDYVLRVDDEDEALCEAKSPSVMKKVGEQLPQHGIELTWVRRQSLIPKIFAEVNTPFPISNDTVIQEMYSGRSLFRP